MGDTLFKPEFKTPENLLCKEEQNKLQSSGMRGNLKSEFGNDQSDLSWEAEQLAKSYGIYLEFNRNKPGEQKDWIYMIRVGLPGGGQIQAKQWSLFNALADEYAVNPDGHPTLRLTNRQNVQFHWVKKPGVTKIVKALAESKFFTLNGCGDNVRNVMACPLSRYSTLFDSFEFAAKVAHFFQLPTAPFIEIFEIDPKQIESSAPLETSRFDYAPNLLNRKFKIGIGSLHSTPDGLVVADNCVELRTNDLGVAPVWNGSKVTGFQIYVGGGQGERNGKTSLAALGQPLGVVSHSQILPTLNSILTTHQMWGDRANRPWARLKFLIYAKGINWFRDQVEEHLGYRLQAPIPNFDYGKRHLHHGWHFQGKNEKWSYGMYVENGRLTDFGKNGRLKALVSSVLQEFPTSLSITPNQDLLFTDLPTDSRKEFEDRLAYFGYGLREGKPYSNLRKHSGACVGRDTCRLAYTDSEKFEPLLLDELDTMGWGELRESIGITGCERQCFRPSTKTFGLIGSGLNRYQLRLLGTEDGTSQGEPLLCMESNLVFLNSIPAEKVSIVIDTLLQLYRAGALPHEDVGRFFQRIGVQSIIRYLKCATVTAPLMVNGVRPQSRLNPNIETQKSKPLFER